MTTKRETQIIIIGTIIGLVVIVTGYFWLQNYLFPPDAMKDFGRFVKTLNEPDPFDIHYDSSMSHIQKGDYNLALKEGERALGVAEEAFRVNGGTMNAADVRMSHDLLLDIYLAMGDVASAEKELDWLDRDVREGGYWDKKVNAKETLGDIQMSYRHRLDELRKIQQQKGNSSSTIAPRPNEQTSAQ